MKFMHHSSFALNSSSTLSKRLSQSVLRNTPLYSHFNFQALEVKILWYSEHIEIIRTMLDAQFSTKYCFDCEYFVSSNYNLHYFLHTRQNIQRQNSISYKIESQRTSNIVRFHSCVISSLIQNCRLAPDKYF